MTDRAVRSMTWGVMAAMLAAFWGGMLAGAIHSRWLMSAPVPASESAVPAWEPEPPLVLEATP